MNGSRWVPTFVTFRKLPINKNSQIFIFLQRPALSCTVLRNGKSTWASCGIFLIQFTPFLGDSYRALSRAVPLFMWMLNPPDQCWSNNIQNLERNILGEVLRNKIINKKLFFCFFHFIFLTADLSRQTAQVLLTWRALQDMSAWPGGQQSAWVHLPLSMIWIQLLGPGVYDCSDKLPIFITKLFYEYFILCKALVLLKAKVTVPYF